MIRIRLIRITLIRIGGRRISVIPTPGTRLNRSLAHRAQIGGGGRTAPLHSRGPRSVPSTLLTSCFLRRVLEQIQVSQPPVPGCLGNTLYPTVIGQVVQRSYHSRPADPASLRYRFNRRPRLRPLICAVGQVQPDDFGVYRHGMRKHFVKVPEPSASPRIPYPNPFLRGSCGLSASKFAPHHARLLHSKFWQESCGGLS